MHQDRHRSEPSFQHIEGILSLLGRLPSDAFLGQVRKRLTDLREPLDEPSVEVSKS